MSDHPRLPTPPWLWRNFGSGFGLYTQHGGAKVVLMAGGREPEAMLVRDDHGILVPITADHPVAELLGAAPELAKALDDCARQLEMAVTSDPGTTNSYREIAKNARHALLCAGFTSAGQA